MTLRPALLVLSLASSLLAAVASAQTPASSPTPPPPGRDEIEVEGLTSIALGSGARAWGMGGAFLARADDATAASWNPAGLSYLRRPEVSLVGARNSFERGPAGEDSDDRFLGYTPDFTAVAWPLDLGRVSGAVQVSYQRVFSFRGERDIDRTDLDTERLLLHSEYEGGFDVLALGTGVRVTGPLRLGLTVNRWLNGYHLSRLRPGLRFGRRSSLQDIDYRLQGWNLNLGFIWTPRESLNVAVVGKTPFTGTLELERERTDGIEDPLLTTTNQAGPFDVELDFPGAVGVGVSWRLASPLTLSADYTHTFWSRGRIRNFYTLPATPPGQASDPPPPQFYPELYYPTLVEREQSDTSQLRAGVEYVVLGHRLKVPLRAGLFTDRQYYRTGSAGRNVPVFLGLTVGTGILAGPLLFDVAYVRERGRYYDGQFVRTAVGRVFLSLIYRHGARSSALPSGPEPSGS